MEEILAGKRILIVDDEPDVLDTLKELLDMCHIDTAEDFETAKDFFDNNTYDVAILDIMGVRGFELLQIANGKGIPALMLTAHAISPDNLVKSIKEGAQSYVPKEKISQIKTFLGEILKAQRDGIKKHGNWFRRLKPFFDERFGRDWREKDREFWEDFSKSHRISKEEVEDIM